MTAIFDLSTYKCTYPPNPLWRVIHSQSQSRQDPVTKDLVAADSDREISDRLSLKQAAEEHFNWRSRRPSCFLSVFSSEQHARKWAKKRETASGTVYIHEIDTTRLPPGIYIFCAVSLARKLGITHPYSANEFVFLHRIPSESIRHTRSLDDIEEQEVEARAYAAREFNPNYHYVPDLSGWYDSDEECEEHNRSDDIIKFTDVVLNGNKLTKDNIMADVDTADVDTAVDGGCLDNGFFVDENRAA
ncbi:hypothetical protein GQX73_g3195 [Xylaria multiplex]|uniref:DUF7587 domain-containing protein n=1 Tax=Xylaria multiplex TaxID=323545 RepID=A0A7C8MV98_9PEZI|nr:hypothetical protein GQX73_g3195 [Xylaria multiplex]